MFFQRWLQVVGVVIRTEVDASHTIYYSAESSAPRVVYGGESRLDDPECFYSQLFLHHYRVIFFFKITKYLNSC